jgi:hypothetical protein
MIGQLWTFSGWLAPPSCVDDPEPAPQTSREDRMRAPWLRRTTPLALLTLLAGCTGLQQAATGATAGPVPRATGIVVAQGHGWTSAGLDGTIPPAGSCHIHTATDGEPLPDPTCTPGAVDTAVTDANTASTVCRKGGYTSSVRPPESLTEPAKKKLLAAYGIPASQISSYELDHLIDLAGGGASDVRNLWPEPNTFQQFKGSGFVHNDKDAVEAYIFHAICAGKVTVSTAQNAMATDWSTAVATLGLPPIPTGYNG